MWVFLSNAMLSIVAHRTKPRMLLVRARLRGDIERVFPAAKVSRTPDADYLYRAEVARGTVGRVLAEHAEAIQYPNFKSSVPLDHRNRSTAYHDAWDAMMDAQQREAPGSGGVYGRLSGFHPSVRGLGEPFGDLELEDAP